jgi:F0F1-type ATP synthase assembly protein I
MEQAVLPPFAAWETFYILIGSSAAALTGLQFVVIVMGAEANTFSRTTLRAFGTPTIVHFCATLLLSAILSAPWRSVTSAAVCIAVFAALGLAYLLSVVIHAQPQTDYVPVLEDWLWHFVFPLLAYVMFLVTAAGLRHHTPDALFVAAAAALLLLFVGIHNAWDAATYIALERPQRRGRGRGESGETTKA